jgi:hypothetical protein
MAERLDTQYARRSNVTHTEGLLLESKENRVKKLEIFKIIVDHIVKLESLEMDESVIDNGRWR